MTEIPPFEERAYTSKQLAEKFGISERTVQRLVGQPRASYEQRARIRRDKVVEMRKQGKKYVEIAEELGITTGAVSSIIREARKIRPAAAAGTPP